MQKYYEILGVSEYASEEEINEAYKTLKAKYSKERFLEGDDGNRAARNLTKLETAYQEIMNSKKNRQEDSKSSSVDYVDVETLIKKGDISGAQLKLDDITERNAEWHYLQSVIFYKKNWTNESKKQLEIAMNMEPHNAKYSEAYTKLKQKMAFNDRQYHSGNANFNESQNEGAQRQMGGSDTNNCMNYCTTMCCMNLLCNMCCNCY